MIKVKSKPKENANTVRKKTRWKDFRDNAELSALMIPGIVLLLVFAYVPMLGIIIAFKDYRNNLGIFKSKWVGFQNFKFFFESQDAWRIGRNTVGYGVHNKYIPFDLIMSYVNIRLAYNYSNL